MGIFHFKKHLNSPRTFFKDLGEPEGFPHGLKFPRPRLKHGSCDELSRIFLFFCFTSRRGSERNFLLSSTVLVFTISRFIQYAVLHSMIRKISIFPWIRFYKNGVCLFHLVYFFHTLIHKCKMQDA